MKWDGSDFSDPSDVSDVSDLAEEAWAEGRFAVHTLLLLID